MSYDKEIVLDFISTMSLTYFINTQVAQVRYDLQINNAMINNSTDLIISTRLIIHKTYTRFKHRRRDFCVRV